MIYNFNRLKRLNNKEALSVSEILPELFKFMTRLYQQIQISDAEEILENPNYVAQAELVWQKDLIMQESWQVKRDNQEVFIVTITSSIRMSKDNKECLIY